MVDLEHIDHALIGKAHPSMYLLHKWWARKPHNIVRQYIEAYTKPGDVVLDPFLGSGPTAIEAVRTGRRALGFDLDPLSIFITRMTALPCDIKKLESHYRSVSDAVQKDIEALYRTTCKTCEKEVDITHVIWADIWHCDTCNFEYERGSVATKSTVNACPNCKSAAGLGHKVGSAMLEVGYFCPDCTAPESGRRFLVKEPSASDRERIEQLEKASIPAWVPDDKLFYPDGRPYQKKERAERATDFFNRRALISLSLLFQAIDGLPKGTERDLMLLCFSSNLHSVSRLNMVHGPRWKQGTLPSRAWVIHSFYVPPLRIEFPVWFYFRERFDLFVRAKSETNAELKTKEASSVKALLDGKGNFHCAKHNAIELDEKVPENSVDYVFTDPPYGGAIQYLELSTLYTSWLKGPRGEDFVLEFDDEITINPNQKKDFGYYHQMLRAAFDDVYRVMKPGAYMTVTFHSPDIKVWNSILEAINLSGFENQKVIYQPPPVKSIKSLMQPYGSAVGDYYIRFRKPLQEGSFQGITRDNALYEKVIVQSALRTIARRGEPTPLTIILNGLVPQLQKANGLLKGDRPIVEVLKDHLDEEFRLVNALDESQKVVGQKWWLNRPNQVPFLENVPLDERVERAVLDVLQGHIKVHMDEILQEVFIKFPNSLTPDSVSIQSVLDEYAEKTSDGKWRLKRDVVERESEHSVMIRALAELGKKLDYQIWIGTREQHDVGEGVELRTLLDFHDLVLDGITGQALERVKMVDVLWIKKRKVEALFEVENTTGITDALIRASNIPYPCDRYIVLPEERQGLLSRKLSEPAFRDRFDVDVWKTISYSNLISRWRQTSRKKTLRMKDFLDLVDTGPTQQQGPPQLF